ncbi:MAG: hypothetical protein HDR50_12005 [Desulfovibrio sp.]|uniref:hypothetical protein n=1 Tax=Desulfovibrio sp. TaxID=885 RepID=UPI001A7BCB2D|nr:hypothetical protein [Desulfovibrio sp.]MBD5418335.1 hypothetical protein [Desulfovibrio sp.]
MGKIMTFIGGAATAIIGIATACLIFDKLFPSKADISSVPDNDGNIGMGSDQNHTSDR